MHVAIMLKLVAITVSIPLAHPQHATRPQIPPRRGRPQLNFSQTKEKVGLDKMG